MGNSASSANLSIILDDINDANDTARQRAGFGKCYLAGSTISGSVYAQTKKNINNPSSIDVQAYIAGKERTRVRYKSGDDTHYSNATRDVLRIKINLGDFDRISNVPGLQQQGVVPAGAKFRFPFAVELPRDLPSTMSTSGQGGHCTIDYKVKALIGGTHAKTEVIFNVLSAPLPSQPVPNCITPVTKTVTRMCSTIGRITMGAKIENTRIARGESAVIHFACKNRSRKKIIKVECFVKQYSRWKAGSHSNSTKEYVSKKVFNRTSRWGEMTKEEVKELKMKSKSPTDSYRDNEQNLLRMIYNAINDGENRCILPIPVPSSLQSYGGALITVYHMLKIKVYFDGACNVEPEFKIPVSLGTPASLSDATALPSQPYVDPLEAPPPPEVPIGDVPIVSAIPISNPTQQLPAPSAPPAPWASAVTASPVVVGTSMAVVGGTIWEGDRSATTTNQSNLYVPIAEVVPNIPNLVNEITLAISPLDTCRKWIRKENLSKMFTNMSPTEYSSVIKAVSIEFDQPEVAVLIAPEIRSFTHQYVIAAIKSCSNWLRVDMVTKLLPYCEDLPTNGGLIREELNDWERVCTEREFAETLRNRY